MYQDKGARQDRLVYDGVICFVESFMFFGFGYLISDRSLMRPVTDSYQQIARTKFFDITSATWISLVVVILASILLTRTRFGRNVFATGGNQEAARLAGINVPQVQAITFIFTKNFIIFNTKSTKNIDLYKELHHF